jgi:glycosyltransferase involved in cell wall biosynthesis
MNTPPVSMAVITHNSEETLEPCLRSAEGWTAETVLVDDHSSDATLAVAKSRGAKIFTRKLESCAAQKQFALDQCSNDWAFLLDSDESCSETLKREILEIASRPARFAAYRVPRRNYYFGKWLRRGGKFPDYQVRFFRRSLVRYSDHFSHEKVIVNGATGTLRGWIDHQAYPNLDIWWLKLKRTAEFDALEWNRNGIKPSGFNFMKLCILRPAKRFASKYLLKLGFLDGVPGLLAALHDVLTQILTYHILSQSVQA